MKMAVLSTYLSDIQGAIDEETGERLHLSRPIMCRSDYEGWGDERHLRHGQQPEGVPGIHSRFRPLNRIGLLASASLERTLCRSGAV